MRVGIVGLGRMGKNICLRLLEQGVTVIAFNRSREKVDEVVTAGAIGTYSLSEFAEKMQGSGDPIIVLLYVPAKEVVDEMLFSHDEWVGLTDLLPKDSIIIDGGNSFYKNSQKRYPLIAQKGMRFLDMGTSGGLDGARRGACLMVGGDETVYRQVEPLLALIATKDGYGYVGPAGSGHFVKMVHNAVEYGMMGAIAEGFNIIQNSELNDQNSKKFNFDLAQIAKIWAHGSIVAGLLMNKTQSAFEKDPQLASLSGEVPYGETEEEMEWLESLGQPMPVISTSRKHRVDSRTKPSFIGKVIAALRREFGGHSVK